MKEILRRVLIFVLILALTPVTAMAAQVKISIGGTLGLMYEGQSVTLRPRVWGVSRNALSWTSSNPAAAGVTGGRITGMAEGYTTITASAGGASAECGVVVLPRSISMSVGQSHSLPCAGKEAYRVQHASIASVSNKGVITAKAAGTTRVLVGYGRQRMLITVRVSAADNGFVQTPALPSQSKAAQLSCANATNQIVLVEHQSGSKAKLSIHEKKNGLWTELYSCTAYVGSKGIGKTKEGDKKTPTGTFNLNQPFGIKADPGANMPYTKVTKYHYWCGTSSSEYYNRMVDSRVTGRKHTSSDEHLISYGSVYNYCMFIDYNAEGVAGKGSCIFLHCTGRNKYTAGCIAVSEGVMKKIIQWAQPGAKIVIQ